MKYMNALTLLTLILSESAFAGNSDTITIDHRNNTDGNYFESDVEAPGVLTIDIKNTCEKFLISAKGLKITPDIKTQPETSAKSLLGLGPNCKALMTKTEGRLKKVRDCSLQNKTIHIPHTEEFGGYFVDIIGTNGQDSYTALSDMDFKNLKTDIESTITGCTEADTKPSENAIDASFNSIKVTTLKNQRHSISVQTTSWRTSFSGGLANSFLTNPEYHIGKIGDTTTTNNDGSTTTSDKMGILRDQGAENSTNLIMTGFVHISNDRCRIKKLNCSGANLAVGFGSNGDALDYFIGFGWKLGPAYITAGRHWGQVNRLANGLIVGETVIDGTTLTKDVINSDSLLTRTDSANFLSVTFEFGGSSDKTVKKFATAGGQ